MKSTLRDDPWYRRPHGHILKEVSLLILLTLLINHDILEVVPGDETSLEDSVFALI